MLKHLKIYYQQKNLISSQWILNSWKKLWRPLWLKGDRKVAMKTKEKAFRNTNNKEETDGTLEESDIS